MVLFVALRITIGWHFFYEGVWKITNPGFSAEGFLKNAKGPAAPMFYAMLPDIDGTQRLAVDTVPVSDELRDYWRKLRDDAQTRTERELLKDEADRKAGREKVRRFTIASRRLLWETEDKLDAAIEQSSHAIMAATGAGKEAEEATVQSVKNLLGRLHEIEQSYLDRLAKLKAEAVGGDPPRYEPRVPAKPDEMAADEIIRGKTIRGRGNQPLVVIEREVVGPEHTYVDRWRQLLDATIRKFNPNDDQQYELQRIFRRYQDSVDTVLDENEVDIATYFEALDRHQAQQAEGNNPPFQQARNWAEMQELRGEAGGWLGELDQMEQDLADAMWNVLDDKQKARGGMPVGWTQTDLLNLAVTWGLTLIGLCLMIGLATRLAAIGGGVFLIFVLLTQPPWPTIFPPAPEVVGHALIVDKNFVEMVAIFLLAASPVGRWAGLDYFLENFVLRQWEKRSHKS